MNTISQSAIQQAKELNLPIFPTIHLFETTWSNPKVGFLASIDIAESTVSQAIAYFKELNKEIFTAQIVECEFVIMPPLDHTKQFRIGIIGFKK